jgi:DNA topoisomerase-1
MHEPPTLVPPATVATAPAGTDRSRRRAPGKKGAGARKNGRRRVTILDRLRASGIHRLGTKEAGFQYQHAKGHVVGEDTLERIRALRIPPAWQDVVIHASPKGPVQAMGRDAAGRWQYIYHQRHVAKRERHKFHRLIHFIEALPRMRAAVERDMRRRGLPREKVLACMLRILSTCFMRPGSEVYASENRSYGIATLRSRHVQVHGDTVEFDFRGKSGKRQQRELRDRSVARIVRELLKVQGAEVFKFVNGGGAIVDVGRRHVNDYIKEVMGERFSAKDFRTWAGTLICACALARVGVKRRESPRVRKSKVVAAIKETAEQLGNTPAICKASYINPYVLERFTRGAVIDAHLKGRDDLVAYRDHGLHPAEKALLAMLREKARPSGSRKTAAAA